MIDLKVKRLALVGTGMVLFAFFFANDGRDLGPSKRLQTGAQIVSQTATVRIGPSFDAKATNKLYRGQTLEAFEVQGSWLRISPYYDGRVEGVEGQVARWILYVDLEER